MDSIDELKQMLNDDKQFLSTINHVDLLDPSNLHNSFENSHSFFEFKNFFETEIIPEQSTEEQM